MALSLFEHERAAFKRKQRERRANLRAAQRREDLEGKSLEAALQRIPEVISELEGQDPRFKRYMARAERVGGIPISSRKPEPSASPNRRKRAEKALTGKERRDLERKLLKGLQKALEAGPKPLAIGVVLASHRFRVEHWSQFQRRMVSGEDELVIMLVRQGKRAWAGVYQHVYEKIGYVWREHSPGENAKIADMIRKLSNPEAALMVLFDHRPPR